MKAALSHVRSILSKKEYHELEVAYSEYTHQIHIVSAIKKKSNFLSLDNWLWKDYPQEVREREVQYLTKEELQQIMTWKLIKGQFRPTLLGLIQQNSNENVREITTLALDELQKGEWKNAMEKLTELRGVGPGEFISLFICFVVIFF
jgi:hypothetical protein